MTMDTRVGLVIEASKLCAGDVVLYLDAPPTRVLRVMLDTDSIEVLFLSPATGESISRVIPLEHLMMRGLRHGE